MSANEGPAPFKWIGGDLSLDFNNTVDWTGLEPQAGERLTHYGQLVAWALEGGAVDKSIASSLQAAGNKQPDEAETALGDALKTRHLIHRVFFSVIKRPDAVQEDLIQLNELLAEFPPQLEFNEADRRFNWTCPPRRGLLINILHPIVWSASQLLASPDVARVKTCDNDACGWLFLDSSRKHNRKWCEMAVCGNRAKARRFYERSKERTQL